MDMASRQSLISNQSMQAEFSTPTARIISIPKPDSECTPIDESSASQVINHHVERNPPSASMNVNHASTDVRTERSTLLSDEGNPISNDGNIKIDEVRSDARRSSAMLSNSVISEEISEEICNTSNCSDSTRQLAHISQTQTNGSSGNFSSSVKPNSGAGNQSNSLLFNDKSAKLSTETAENARSASQAARMHMLDAQDDKPQYKQQNDSYGQVNNKELSQQLINAPANPTAAWSQPNAKIDDSKLARSNNYLITFRFSI